MTISAKFERNLIAPCGMNCGTCLAYLRDKNKCCGCWPETGHKVNHCFTCSIKNCEYLAITSSKFCYECEKFPCKRLKQLDKRYRTKYRTSFIENLLSIKEKGITEFLEGQTARWTCDKCGATLCCHRSNCLTCNTEYKA